MRVLALNRIHTTRASESVSSAEAIRTRTISSSGSVGWVGRSMTVLASAPQLAANAMRPSYWPRKSSLLGGWRKSLYSSTTGVSDARRYSIPERRQALGRGRHSSPRGNLGASPIAPSLREAFGRPRCCPAHAAPIQATKASHTPQSGYSSLPAQSQRFR